MLKKIGLIVFGIVIGSLAVIFFDDGIEKKRTQANAFPLVAFGLECVQPKETELKLYNSAVELFDIASKERNWTLVVGIEEFLSRGIYRTTGQETNFVCPPKGLYNKVGKIISRDKGLEARLVDYQLELVQKIEDPDEYIIERIAEVAFSKTPYLEIPTYGSYQIDLRARARVILAQSKLASKKYAARAYNEISNTSFLGTTAAQIAAKANYKDSLIKIEALMHELLTSTSKSKALDFSTRDRFRELGYALVLGGQPAIKRTSALDLVLKRKVLSYATMFGNLELEPKRMCEIYDLIDPLNEVTKTYSYCIDDKYPIAQ